MNQITFTFNGATWVVLNYSFGYNQGQQGGREHGIPMPQPVTLALIFNNDESQQLLEWAQSQGDHYDGTLNYIQNGQTVKQISLSDAVAVGYRQVGKFDPNPAIGGGIVEELTLLVKEVS